MNLAGIEFFSIEIGPDCNLSGEHKLCPTLEERFPDTSRGLLSTGEIIRVIENAVEHGFDGYVAFHYYNEPLLYQDMIRKVITNSDYDKFCLWSNGLLLSKIAAENDILSLFSKVVLSNYHKNDVWFDELKTVYPQVSYFTPVMDSRISNYDNALVDEAVVCSRPRFEIPVDCYGGVHLCCQDWRGEYPLGNIRDFEATLKAWEVASQGLLLGALTPNVCRQCPNRMLP